MNTRERSKDLRVMQLALHGPGPAVHELTSNSHESDNLQLTSSLQLRVYKFWTASTHRPSYSNLQHVCDITKCDLLFQTWRLNLNTSSTYVRYTDHLGSRKLLTIRQVHIFALPLELEPCDTVSMMAAANSSKRLGLLDLPPEIRNMIYLLLAPEPDSSIYSLGGRHLLQFMIGQRYRSLVRLLRTSHQIHGEVAYLAYGAATFAFDCNKQKLQWLRDLGDMKQHLRKVHIDSVATTYLTSVFHQLKEARQLESLTFGYWCYRKFRERGFTAEHLGEALGPLAKALMKVRRLQSASTDIKEDICEIFCMETVSDVSRTGIGRSQFRTPLGTNLRPINDFQRALRARLRYILS